MSFPTLFEAYKSLLFQKRLKEQREQTQTDGTDGGRTTLTLAASDIQTATKRIFALATQQNTATLHGASFYETLSSHFLLSINDKYRCTPLLKEIGWDLLTELFLLYNKDDRFDRFLYAICWDISPRELSIMFSEVFCHPMLSINATHHHYQLHTIQNHYILNEENSEQQGQMMLNLNITNQSINMDASDDILSFHKNINYIRVQQVFIECIIILFERLTENITSKHTINHFYQSLIPTAILHFQTLSKEISYQFYLHNTTQYHTHHDHHHHSPFGAMSNVSKERQEWLVNSKKQYESYLDRIYALFALMVNNHCNLRNHETDIKDVPIDIERLICVFGEEEENKEDTDNKTNDLNTLWLARYGFGVLSGVYWWYNVFYNEDAENDGDVNNDSVDVLHNMKRPSYNIFLNDIVDTLKREILVKLCHSVGMNGNVLLSIREYLCSMEETLESLKPWHLNTEQLNQQQINKSNPTTPTPQLKPMSSMGNPDLNSIVEEQEDDMIDLRLNGENEEEATEATQGAHKGEELVLDVDFDDEDFEEIDPSKLKKMQQTQQLVDELNIWNEYMELFGVTCYYHSLWVLLQSDDCTENEGELFKKHSKHIWKCIQLLFDQLTTLPAGIEFGEFILKKTLLNSTLLNSAQFHDQGLWALVQSLTQQLKGISDRALHQKLWQFIVHLINSADLKTRFQCIVSTALQCPIPVVQSLMFTELKNQIFNHWNVDLNVKEDAIMEDAMNPFCSRQVVMVLVQRLGKELQNMSLQTINSELDSLNACLNLCRFLLMKDKETNYTQIYDDDCPLRVVIQSLFDEMTKIANEQQENDKQKAKDKDKDSDGHISNELQRFQRQMMKNQFLVSLDLVKRIKEMYTTK